MPITRDSLVTYRDERLQEKQELQLKKQEDQQLVEEEIKVILAKKLEEIDRKHEIRGAELNAEIKILDDLIKEQEEL
ncbi:MAG: hypothetical protein RG740_05045 [Acholeplasmataceae bacterium]|nr:hypothetical protein [Acholeplasmataceae bacterium]